MKHIFALGSCLLFLVFSAHAQVKPSKAIAAMSLEDAIQTALRENPHYKGAKSNARAAEGLTEQSGLWDNPVLFGKTEEWPIDSSIEESRYLFGLSQTVPFPGKTRLERSAAIEEEHSRNSLSESTRIALVERVRVAFYRVLASKELVAVSKQLLSLAQSSVETARERLEAGASTAQELLRAEVQAQRAKNAIVGFERNLKVARAELALAIGEPEGTAIAVTGQLLEEIPENLRTFDQETILEKHPKILAAQALVRRSTALKERAKLDPYPDITFSASGGRREIDDETLVDFGFSLPIPIFNTSKGEVFAAHAKQKKAENELAQVKQHIKTQLSNAIATLTQTAEQAENYRTRLIPQSEKALAMVQTGFREGQYGFNDLLDTQRTVAEAKIEYLRVLFAFNKSIAEVKSLTELEESF